MVALLSQAPGVSLLPPAGQFAAQRRSASKLSTEEVRVWEGLPEPVPDFVAAYVRGEEHPMLSAAPLEGGQGMAALSSFASASERGRGGEDGACAASVALSAAMSAAADCGAVC